ncbi:MAG: hypothetical protein EAX96_05695 [Candidatus Lokiarchaeota archaeon]|nr:hypothetical protein [Candidatus Lokiarchaeota archaeon]
MKQFTWWAQKRRSLFITELMGLFRNALLGIIMLVSGLGCICWIGTWSVAWTWELTNMFYNSALASLIATSLSVVLNPFAIILGLSILYVRYQCALES